MPETSNLTVLTVSNPEVMEEQPANNWKPWTKAGLIFAGTVGTFLALKTTGSFGALTSWLRKSEESMSETVIDKSVRVEDNPTFIRENVIIDRLEDITKLTDFTELPNLPQRALRGIEPPILGNNQLLINRGGTKVFTTDNLSATDTDDDDTTLLFTISDLQHGGFQFLNGTVVIEFPQQEIISRNIQFVHDDTNVAPAYKVDVSDGALSTTPASAVITFTSGYGPYGTEFQVNTHTVNMQHASSIAALSDGNFVVVYESDLSGWYTPDIRGQMYHNNGTRYGTEFMANTYTSNGQGDPAVADLGNGKFIVAWHSHLFTGDASEIYGQMYNYDGTRYSGEFQISTYTADNLNGVEIASLSDDKFVVIWDSTEYHLPIGQDGSGFGVFGQILNNNGTRYGSEFQVNTYTTDNQYGSVVASLKDGKFVAVWHSFGQDGSSVSIYGQIYNNDGSLYGGEFQINTFTNGGQGSPAAAGLSDGKFIVTWGSYSVGVQDGSMGGVYGQMYNNDGTRYGNEFQINTYTNDDQNLVVAAVLNNGRFLVTWTSQYQDGSNEGIYGQVYYNDGIRFGNEFQINTYTNSKQYGAHSISLTNSKFVVVWTGGYWGQGHQDGSDAGIFGQMFEENIAPTLVNNALTINQGQGVVLTDSEISATDVDNDDADLIFSINGIQYGQFEFVSNSTVITTFSQQQVIAGNVRFVHDGSANAPAYVVAVNDWELSTSFVPAEITFISDSSSSDSSISSVQESSSSSQERILSSSESSSIGMSSPLPSSHESSIALSAPSDSSMQVVSTSSLDYISSEDVLVSNDSRSSESSSSKSSKLLDVISYNSSNESINDNSMLLIIAGVMCGTIIICGGIFAILWYNLKKRVGTEERLPDIRLVDVKGKSEKESRITLQIIPKSEFELGKVIGNGASGIVYQGIWKDKDVAIKQLTDTSFKQDKLQEFESEAALMNKLKNPLIIQFYGICPEPDFYGIVMEYMPNGSLDRVLYSKRDLPWNPLRWQIVSDITHGLCYLHEQNIMHRDLKSPNILLDEDLHAKITDFGIAKIIEDPTKTMTKGRGTPCWMAPEVMRIEEASQKKRYTYKADVYSYGIVLWEIAAREEPYTGLDIFKLYEKIKEEGRPEIKKSFLPPEQSKSYAGLMRCCWAQDPDQRPSMEEVKNRLNTILSDKKAEPQYPVVAEHTIRHNKKRHKAVMDTQDFMSFSYDISHHDLQCRESDKLGEGGFGVVYRGMWLNHTEAAIKQLHVQEMSKDMKDAFKKEASMMATLHHPNIVQLFGVCLEKGHYSIVMEYFPQGSLDKVLHSNESLTWQQRRQIAYDVSRGLSYLHGKAILHRDLKSSNVLLNKQMTAKLSDFGLSRGEDAQLTRQSVGTLAWMAPELFESGAEYTQKSDVYSYGMILWELSSRKKPFNEATNGAQIIGAVTSGQRLNIPEDCPTSMAKLISRCWAQKPKQRPEIEEVVNEYADATSITTEHLEEAKISVPTTDSDSYRIDSSRIDSSLLSYQFTSV